MTKNLQTFTFDVTWKNVLIVIIIMIIILVLIINNHV